MNYKDVTIEGNAFIGNEINLFSFAPNVPVPGSVERYRRRGVAQQMSDGSFDFVAQPNLRSQSILIKKFAHGRVSETKDGAIQLTLKVFKDEGVNISEAIAQEAYQASMAIREFQLKR